MTRSSHDESSRRPVIIPYAPAPAGTGRKSAHTAMATWMACYAVANFAAVSREAMFEGWAVCMFVVAGPLLTVLCAVVIRLFTGYSFRLWEWCVYLAAAAVCWVLTVIIMMWAAAASC